MRLSLVEYKKRKESLMEALNIGKTEYIELIKGDYDEGAGRAAAAELVGAFSSKGNRTLITRTLDDWDFVWYYKRNLHIITPEPEAYVIPEGGIDTSCLNSLDKDIDIDTMINGVQVYIRLIHRNIPIVLRTSSCYWTIEGFNNYGDKIHFSFSGGSSIKKVFVSCDKACRTCSNCNKINDVNGYPYSIRPRYRESCEYNQISLDPMFLLSICMEVASTYVNREKMVKSRKNEDRCKIRNLMVASNETTEGTERLMSMFEYVKEYHESEKQEYKGGHHASPVSHTRSGYYRKSRTGSYNIKDGDFVFVGKGLGKFSYVPPTIVNAHRDEVMSEIV